MTRFLVASVIAFVFVGCKTTQHSGPSSIGTTNAKKVVRVLSVKSLSESMQWTIDKLTEKQGNIALAEVRNFDNEKYWALLRPEYINDDEIYESRTLPVKVSDLSIKTMDSFVIGTYKDNSIQDLCSGEFKSICDLNWDKHGFLLSVRNTNAIYALDNKIGKIEKLVMGPATADITPKEMSDDEWKKYLSQFPPLVHKVENAPGITGTRDCVQSYEVTSIDWQVDPSYVQLPKTLLLAITGRYEDGSIDRWSCTGFFLNESNLIATAAHCVKPKVPVKEMWVNAWAGVHRRDGGATVRPFSYGIVDGGVVHPSYDPTSQTTPLTTRFDVAALKIKPDYFSSISRATRDSSARYFMRHMRNVDFSIPYRQFGYGVDLDGINTETERKLLGRKDTPFSPYIVYYYFANMQLYPGDSGSPIFQWAALPPNYPNPGDNTIGIVSAQPKDGSCGAYVAPLGDDYLDLILQVTQ